MNIQDANKLLALAKANYSYAFKSMSRQEKLMLVQSWAFTLQDIPADIVMLAFMQLLSTSKWLPTVAEIREKVKSLYYSAAYHHTGFPGNEEPDGVKKARKYIEDHTYMLRGDEAPELTLDSILRGGYGPTLGSGEMGFESLESGTDYLPEPEPEEFGYET